MVRWLTTALVAITVAGCAAVGPGSPISPHDPAVDDPAPVAPFAADSSQWDHPLRKGASADIVGSVTLNGSVVTDPIYETSPFGVTIPGKSGDIALIAVSANAIPNELNNVRLKLAGATTSYPTQNFNTNNTVGYLPTMITKTEPLTLNLYNSNTETSPLFSQAVKWSGYLRTVPKEDPGEPNDDENPSTFTDLSLATDLGLDTPLTFSMYQRTAGSAQDQEDWYRIPMAAGQVYRIGFIDSNGTWGNWSYTLTLTDSAGSTQMLHAGITGTSDIMVFTAPDYGSYYLQVIGTPLTRRGSSVYFSQQILNYHAVASPLITQVTPGGVAGCPAGAAIFAATVSESPISSWSWDFGGGASPNTSTLASPTVTLGAPGYYTGVVRAGNESGLGPPFLFSYTVGAVAPRFGTHLVEAGAESIPAIIPLSTGRLAIAYSKGFNLRFAVANTANPRTTADWTVHTVASGSPRTGDSPTMSLVGGMPVIAYWNSGAWCMNIARATVAQPTSASQWVIRAVDSTGIRFQGNVLDLGGRIGIAYFRGDSFTDLRFARAFTATPDTGADWSIHTIDNSANTGLMCSATVVGGKPVVAYGENSDPGLHSAIFLKVARANGDTPGSSTDWTKHRVMFSSIGDNDRADGTGNGTISLTSVNGRLVCGVCNSSYGTPSQGNYLICRAQTTTPASEYDWKVYGMGIWGLGGPQSLGVVNGRLALVLNGYGDGTLMVFRAVRPDPTCASDWLAATSPDSVGGWPAVCDYQGQLAVAYGSNTKGGLSCARQDYNTW